MGSVYTPLGGCPLARAQTAHPPHLLVASPAKIFWEISAQSCGALSLCVQCILVLAFILFEKFMSMGVLPAYMSVHYCCLIAFFWGDNTHKHTHSCIHIHRIYSFVGSTNYDFLNVTEYVF